MGKIKRNTLDYRIWLKHINEKDLALRTKLKQYKRKKATRQNEYNRKIKESKLYNERTNRFDFTAPKCFSVLKNSEETIEFFNSIISFITDKRNYGKQIFIDISNINELTIDALMYLIAIVNNLNDKFRDKYSFSGNAPTDPKINKKFIESGFYKFVRYRGREPLTRSKDNLQIVSGVNSDPLLASRISDFVVEKAKLENPRKCGFLFNLVTELMSNVYKHAYNNSVLVPHWYCYAEYENNNMISFIFMDTGESIPATVKKHFTEKIDLLKIKGDCKYVESALNGDFRTATNKKKHGKGLPKIREICTSGRLENFKVVTRKANVSVLDKSYDSYEMKVAMVGTLYYWQFDISELKGVL